MSTANHLKHAQLWSIGLVTVLVFLSVSTRAQSDGLQLYRHVFIALSPQGDTVYSNIELQLAQIELEDSAVSASISDFLLQTVAEHLSLDEEAVANRNVLDAAVSFESACKGAQEDGWYRSWDYWGATSVIFQSPTVFCVEFDEDSYTGGAHSLHYQGLFNFDSATGRLMSWNEMVTDTAAFSSVAKTYFWKNKEEAFGSEVENDEFFWGGDFYLPENIGFVEDGVLLLYNEYEAAPYVYGAQYCLIPYTELKGILKPQYLPSE
jgi:hypothetical protein